MDFAVLARARKSVRGFDGRQVSAEAIQAMLEAAVQAPSGGNCQPWHFYVVRDERLLREIGERSYKAAWFRTAPAAIVVCANAERSGARYGDRGRTLYCIQDTAAAVQNLLLSAKSQGIGTCWCGAFDEDAMREVLSIPAHLRPVALIPVGYAERESEKRPRRPMSEVVTVL